ncbi:MAG: nuclear transport factor 2 family protein [Actinomycetota bacterium]|nr:nuclear transport factor 2 family protein [Actinomycetota bacterium]
MGEDEHHRMMERMFAVATGRYDAEAEYEMRHETDFVRDFPQSRERIRGRDNMRAMQRAFPTPPATAPRRIIGSGDVWIAEVDNDYGDDPFHVVVIVEFRDGRIVRETAYYTKPFEPPEWRAQWVERM